MAGRKTNIESLERYEQAVVAGLPSGDSVLIAFYSHSLLETLGATEFVVFSNTWKKTMEGEFSDRCSEIIGVVYDKRGIRLTYPDYVLSQRLYLCSDVRTRYMIALLYTAMSLFPQFTGTDPLVTAAHILSSTNPIFLACYTGTKSIHAIVPLLKCLH